MSRPAHRGRLALLPHLARSFARWVPAIGSRTVLLGVHCAVIHPWFVAWGWWRLYGWPRDLRLWVAFFLHDIGYWGQPNLDGPAGQHHPERGGQIMAGLFGPAWGQFTLYHSRHYARLAGRPVSPLCAADKLATTLYPWWLYGGLARLSGELDGYLDLANQHGFVGREGHAWFRWLQADWQALAYRQAAAVPGPLWPGGPTLPESGSTV